MALVEMLYPSVRMRRSPTQRRPSSISSRAFTRTPSLSTCVCLSLASGAPARALGVGVGVYRDLTGGRRSPASRITRELVHPGVQ